MTITCYTKSVATAPFDEISLLRNLDKVSKNNKLFVIEIRSYLMQIANILLWRTHGS